MVDPYVPPESSGDVSRKVSEVSNLAPVIGCLSGGCLLPVILFFGCAYFLGDTGGLLFWPMIAVPLGLLGMIFGFVYRHSKK